MTKNDIDNKNIVVKYYETDFVSALTLIEI